jgi:hypothetical protein
MAMVISSAITIAKPTARRVPIFRFLVKLMGSPTGGATTSGRFGQGRRGWRAPARGDPELLVQERL